MACGSGADEAFGPRVDPSCRSLDFTLQFEDIFIACLPPSVFLLLAPFDLGFLGRLKPASFLCRPKLLIGKLIGWATLLACQLAFLVVRAESPAYKTSASLPADILALVAIGTGMWLSVVSHRRSLRPSTVLSLYLSASVLLAVPRVHTLWLMEATSRGAGAALLTAVCVLTAVALALESVEIPTTPLVAAAAAAGGDGMPSTAPEQYSGFWNRTSFAWLAATFRAGYGRVISLSDLPELDPKLESRTLGRKLESTWAQYDYKGRYSLLRACIRSFLPAFISVVMPRLCVTAFTFTQPFLINTTISFVADPDADPNTGRALIGAWALAYLGIAISTSVFQYQNLRCVTRLRGSLITLIYRRSLQIRTAEQGEITAVTLMGTDVERIASGFQLFHEVWGSLLDIAIACWLLERQLFLACLAPVLLVGVFVGFTFKLSSSMKNAQRQWIEKVQHRLKVTSDFLGDMKAIKMLGLSQTMSANIQKLRADEIGTSKSYRKLLIAMIMLSITPFNLAPVVTLATYVVISVFWKNETLLTSQAFTSVALISLLATPVAVFIQALPNVVQSLASFERIEEYYHYARSCSDQTDNDGDHDEQSTNINLPEYQKSRHLVLLENRSFAWTKTGPTVLKDISVAIKTGTITAVTGPVASGKTALLHAILGELASVPLASISAEEQQEYTEKAKNAAIPITGPAVAYCSQEPWLENATIRDNVLGAGQYDAEWYKTVVSACGLDADFSQLDRGDQTFIGSKGGALSGGQKQRVALARAVYARFSLVLLDDVFSGMDSSTVAAVFKRLLSRDGGLLRSFPTTVVITTHSWKVISSFADHVIVLQDGKALDMGTPDSLLGRSAEAGVAKSGLLENDNDKVAATETLQITSQPILTPGTTNAPPVDVRESTASPVTDLRRKKGDLSVYSYYMARSGYMVVGWYMASATLWTFFTEFSTIWVKWWSESNEVQPNARAGMYVGVYALFGVLATLSACATAWFAFISIISNSALRLHADLLESTIRAPFLFFTTTDHGEILNRFSQDMESIDMDLPATLVNYTSTALSAMAQLLVLAVFSRYLGITLPFLFACLYFLQRFYLRTSRQLRLLDLECRAPLYSHFSETASNSSSTANIRAFQWQTHHCRRNERLVDDSQRPVYLLACVQGWLGFMLNLIVAVLAVVLVTTVITWKEQFSPGSVGVSLVVVVGFNEILARLIRTWAKLETSVGSVARVKRFMEETERERTAVTTDDDGRAAAGLPSAAWPDTGAIEFAGVVASYSRGANPVIKGVSMTVRPGDHIAICGRTGSGKTSFILSMLRMIDLSAGEIIIDGIRLSRLSSADVCSQVAAVPQDSILIAGKTMRFNIDPWGKASDNEIIRVLERIRLWAVLQEQGGGGLDQIMDTTTWSAGQKQLLCFARAMVAKRKIIVLDEAMSSVDHETESVMQEIIDSDFKHCTVLAVMHRIANILSYDKVALFDQGLLLEYDETAKLIAGDTRFSQLYRSR